jgi:hypothetical protein
MGEGGVDVAIFSGPQAEVLAREYHDWKMRQGRPKKSTVVLRLVRPTKAEHEPT